MKRKISLIIILFFIFSYLLLSCYGSTSLHINTKNKLIVHYIDVGQGDAALIQVNSKNILIDTGPKDNKNDLFSYLNLLNIKTIHYLIATHPHEDHIGNVSDIIDSFNILKFYAPKIKSTTKNFEEMLDALKDKNLKINIIKAGTNSIDLGTGTKVYIYSPNKDIYDNLNNYSPIIKIKYGSTSFLFTGDAEGDIEKDVLEKGYDINADVLKLGHHGSSTSTTTEFINKVNPKLAIISVGKDNPYGHPDKEITQKLKSMKINYYRTDLNGNIILISDGNTLYVKTIKIACNENYFSLHAILHCIPLLFLFLLF